MSAGWSGALRAEWLRFWSLTSHRVTVVLLLLWVPVNNALLTTVRLQLAAERAPGESLPPVPGTALVDSVLWAQLILAVLAARSVTAEYSSGVIRLALLASPLRTPVVLAKAAVLALVGACVGAFGVASGVLLPALLLPGAGVELQLGVGRAVELALLSAGYLAAIGVIGVALGILIRGAVLGVLVPLTLLSIVPAMLESIGNPIITRCVGFLPSIAGRVALTTFENPAGLGAGAGLIVLWAWAIGLGALAAWVLRARDA